MFRQDENFLKSANVETKHIVDEFIRVALAHPEIGFSLISNGHELYRMKASNLRQRVVNVLGENFNERLVPINEETDYLKITGFVGKPEFARKTRGEQYIFANRRFIKSAYINHAIYSAYSDMIPKDKYPLFILYLTIDPSRMDVNVHPTKQEVKFEDEKLIYSFVNSASRHGLSQYSVSPSLDFEQENMFNQMGTFDNPPKDFNLQKSPINISKSDFPFTSKKKEKDNLENWQDVYEIARKDASYTIPSKEQKEFIEPNNEKVNTEVKPYQIHERYIVSPIRSGFIFIDQRAAHERILFERFLQQLEHNEPVKQQQLFPKTLEFSSADAEILKEVLSEINKLGFDIQEFGNNAFVVHSLPSDIGVTDQKVLLDELIEQYKNSYKLGMLSQRESVARSLALGANIKQGKKLTDEEMRTLIDELFACENPYTTPTGRKTFIKYALGDLEKMFEPKK